MGDSSQAPSALEAEARALVEDALAKVAADRDETPQEVVERLEQRARLPDHRLVVGRYLVIGELGRGGMGVVYEGWDPGIERLVAIKTIEPDLVPEEEREEVVERFRRETKVVGRLHHPSIVTIFDSGTEHEFDPVKGQRVPVLYYYVMEYLEGQSLARVLREQCMLPDADSVRIARDIAEALHLSHQAGIIHRDIKPSNIFLRDNLQAVLLDFGIAKTGSVNLTRQGQILGTPSYLAPERLREKEAPIDGRADIFSLGVLLFTMLTGDAPFVGDDIYEVIDKIAKERHPQLERGTPAGTMLSHVIDRMLAKDPNDRYSSADEAAVALDAVLRLLSGERSTSLVPERLLPQSPQSSRMGVGALEERTPFDDEDDTGRLDHPGEQTAPKAQIEQGVASLAAVGDLRVRPSADLEDENVLKKTQVSSPPAEAIEGFGQDEQTKEELPTAREEEDPEEQQDPSDQAATDLLVKAQDGVRVADVLGTRPELALQRETREVTATSPSFLNLRAPAPLEQENPWEDSERTEDPRVVGAILDDRATEQMVRKERPPGAVPRAPMARARRSRIEASLVDEDDVVVKPEPIDGLKPDELPTMAVGSGHPLLSRQSSHPGDRGHGMTSTAAISNPDVVRARGDSRVMDPAEPGQEKTSGGERVPEKKEEEEEEKSAVVGRKTIGSSRAGPISSAAAAIQVRISGRAFGAAHDDKMRMLRRRGVMLLAGALVSVGIGLMLGRMRRGGGTDEEVKAKEERISPKIEPRASVRKVAGADQIELARPRPASELIADAEEAQTARQFEDAGRLFQKAFDSTEEGTPLRARALLGLADVQRAQGQNQEAIAHYRAVIRRYGSSQEAQQARAALFKLNVPPADPPRGSRPEPPNAESHPRAPVSKMEQASAPVNGVQASAPVRGEAKKDVIFKPNDAMSADERCEAIKKQHLLNPAEAVGAFEEMRQKHPNAACVFWNLGRKYEQLGRHRQALSAYRRYIELDPKASQRETIEKKKIPNLEAKLRQ